MTTLREAAQALVDAVTRYDETGGRQPFREMLDYAAALRESLALPDPDRWTEGYRRGREDMRDDAAQRVRDEHRTTRSGPGKDALIRAEHGIRALPPRPVPPAPVTAPEAKPAESETEWRVREEGRLLQFRFRSREGAERWIAELGRPGATAVLTRVTVEPEIAS